MGLVKPLHWRLTKSHRKGKDGRRNHEALLRDWHRTGTIKKNFCSAHLVGKVLVPAPSLSSVPAEPQAGSVQCRNPKHLLFDLDDDFDDAPGPPMLLQEKKKETTETSRHMWCYTYKERPV